MADRCIGAVLFDSIAIADAIIIAVAFNNTYNNKLPRIQ